MAENLSLHKLNANIGEIYHTSPPTFGSWLAGRLLKAEEGYVEMEFAVRQEMCNPAGALHGGVIAAMLDEVAGVTVYSLGHTNYHTSVNLVVDYFAPSIFGQQVTASARLIKRGKKISHLQTELTNSATGRLLARASTNVIWIDKEIGHSHEQAVPEE